MFVRLLFQVRSIFSTSIVSDPVLCLYVSGLRSRSSVCTSIVSGSGLVFVRLLFQVGLVSVRLLFQVRSIVYKSIVSGLGLVFVSLLFQVPV